MFPAVGKNDLVGRVRVAIAAEMGTGIVHADVLADHATAGFSLSLVLLGLHDFPSSEHIVFRAKKIHQLLIVVEKTNHQIVINTFVVKNSITGKIDILRTCRQGQAEFCIDLHQPTHERLKVSGVNL